MMHLYSWLICFAALCLVSVNGEQSCREAIGECGDPNQRTEGENNYTAAVHKAVCRRVEKFDECTNSITSCTQLEQANIVALNRVYDYMCGEDTFDTYVDNYECLGSTSSDEQCDEYTTLYVQSNRTEEEKLARYTAEECRAVKQDLTCTKEVVRKACGEDAAEIYDTYGRIMQHELGKVRGCDIPDPSSAGINSASVLGLVISMACMMMTIG